MFGITDLTAYLIGTVVIILLPGPNSLFVLSVAARQGVRDGYRAASGVMVGDAVLMIASVLGMAALAKAYPGAYLALRLAGAAYLAWLGLGLLRAGWAAWQRARIANAPPLPPLARVENPFARTVGICLTNPKAILFFMSYFIQFVDPAYPHPAFSFLLLGLMLQAISLLYLSTLIFAGSRLAESFRARRRLAASGTGLAGVLFMAFSAKLATASL
jgi:leucine efflux protein